MENTEDPIDQIRAFLQEITDVGPGWAIAISLGLAVGSYLLVRYLVLGIILRRIDPAKHQWLDTIVDAGIPHLLTLLVPPVVIYAILPYYSLESYNVAINVVSRVLTIYVVIVITIVLNAGLHALNRYYNKLDYSKNFPITSILEVVRVILYVLSAIIIISILFRVPAIYILAAVVAIIAAGTVVFNNLILAFVSGLILTSNKLIKIGDWIEIPELRINGKVQEITLTTVVVRNLDHTVGTVPSTYLVTYSFKNWRGVLEEGARQMYWPVHLDADSVKPIDRALQAAIAGLPYGAELLRDAGNPPDSEGPRPHPDGGPYQDTNLGLFREYLTLYLRNHPLMTNRELLSVYFEAPTQFGIPMQVLVSTRETDYTRFLEIQSNVLQDILRLAAAFDLKVFQYKEHLDPRLNPISEP